MYTIFRDLSPRTVGEKVYTCETSFIPQISHLIPYIKKIAFLCRDSNFWDGAFTYVYSITKMNDHKEMKAVLSRISLDLWNITKDSLIHTCIWLMIYLANKFDNPRLFLTKKLIFYLS